MAKLASMSVDALLRLRDEIGAVLSRKANDLKNELARIGGPSMPTSGPRKGRRLGKVAPKYRGPNGDTWAGRGAQPLWLTAELKKGKRREDFLIDKQAKRSSPKKGSRKRRKKAA